MKWQKSLRCVARNRRFTPALSNVGILVTLIGFGLAPWGHVPINNVLIQPKMGYVAQWCEGKKNIKIKIKYNYNIYSGRPPYVAQSELGELHAALYSGSKSTNEVGQPKNYKTSRFLGRSALRCAIWTKGAHTAALYSGSKSTNEVRPKKIIYKITPKRGSGVVLFTLKIN
jgi:hypothetical protein